MIRKTSRNSDLEDEEVGIIYSILGNPHRRKIIMYLGERGKASFTDLKKFLGASVGTLYYNLDNLKNLIEQDEDKKYMLNNKGLRIYEIISKETKRIEEMYKESGLLTRIYKKTLAKVLTPINLFTFMYRNTLVAFIWSALALIIGLSGTASANLSLILFDYKIEMRESIPHIPQMIMLIISWLVIVAISEMLSRILGSRVSRPEFVAAVLVAMLPVLIYPYFYLTAAYFNVLYEWGTVIGLNLVLRVLQVVSICFLTTAISVFKGLSMERAFIISFIIFYISFTISVINF